MSTESLRVQFRKQIIMYCKVKHLDKASIKFYLENIDQFDLDNFTVPDNNAPHKPSV
jgi:hypothetical protein